MSFDAITFKIDLLSHPNEIFELGLRHLSGPDLVVALESLDTVSKEMHSRIQDIAKLVFHSKWEDIQKLCPLVKKQMEKQKNDPTESFQQKLNNLHRALQTFLRAQAPEETHPYDLESYRKFNTAIEDASLRRSWPQIFRRLRFIGRFTTISIRENASALEIRNFMNSLNNQNILRQILNLDLSKKSLLEIPSELKNLKGLRDYLVLDGNDISTINENIFSEFQNLRALELNQNQISKIEGNTFSRLLDLNRLSLNTNQISFIPDNTFSPLQNLTTLDLRKNQITTLSKDVFSRVRALKCLDLSENQISVIHKDAFSNLLNLEWLYLSSNKIKTFNPETFRNLRQLRQIFLNNNQISTVSNEPFSGFQRIERISLNNNQIRELPENFLSESQELTKLDLTNNHLTKLPDSIFSNHPNLAELNVNNNELRVLPEGFAFVPNLKLEVLNNNISIDPWELNAHPPLFFEGVGRRLLADFKKIREQLTYMLMR